LVDVVSHIMYMALTTPFHLAPRLKKKYIYTFTPLSPVVKRWWRAVNNPFPSSADVKEKVELYLYSPSGPS